MENLNDYIHNLLLSFTVLNLYHLIIFLKGDRSYIINTSVLSIISVSLIIYYYYYL